MVRMVLATATLCAAYLGCLSVVRALRRLPLGLALPVALTLLLVLEAVILRALSAVHAIAPAPVAIANLALAAVGALIARRIPGARPPRIPWGKLLGPVPLAVLLLLVPILVVALAYRPNNWDSMTYHLARVAHWIQNRSVAPYPASDPRQVLLPPGAEYLMLVLQVVGGSDRADNLVQLGAWIAVVAAAAPLARCFGARRSVARASTLLIAAAPMAVLQASSTQNDLVAAAAAVAVVSSSLPLLHPGRRCRPGHLALLAAATVGAAMVKPTAFLAAAPLAAWSAGTWLGTWFEASRRFLLPGGALALTLGLALVAPTLSQKGIPDGGDFLYGRRPEVLDRASNVLRGTLRQLAVHHGMGTALAPAQTRGCGRAGSLCLEYGRRPHEDYAGNPVLAVVLIAALAAAALTWRRIPARARLGAAGWVLGWLLLHVTFRDNVWITRLELPSMMLAPLTLGAWPAWRWNAGLGRTVTAALLIAALALGIQTIARNVRRPLAHEQLRAGGREDAYYAPDAPAGLAAWHAQVLDELVASGCRRLVTSIAVDGYDYPITWRAMQRGIEVRPGAGAGDWGCAAFSDGVPPPARSDGWEPTRARGLYLARGGGPGTG